MSIRVLAVLLCVSVAGWAQEADVSVPFHLPTPEGWRTETIPFPLEFAPELEYEGLEELRFAPGMFEKGAEDFWTYAFVWWLSSDVAIGDAELASDLEKYFRGLGLAVAKARGFEPGTLAISADLKQVSASPLHMKGTAAAYDAFVTREPVHLNIDVTTRECGGHTAWLFRLSPQPRTHAVWQTLERIGAEFHCPGP